MHAHGDKREMLGQDAEYLSEERSLRGSSDVHSRKEPQLGHLLSAQQIQRVEQKARRDR